MMITFLRLQQSDLIDKASKNYILDLCHLPHLTFWGDKMKMPQASSVILETTQISPNKL